MTGLWKSWPCPTTRASPSRPYCRSKRLAARITAEAKIILFLKLNSSAGGYYTKKNFWTSITGRLPLYAMGSAVASWLL